MAGLTRFGVSIPSDLLKRFDRRIKGQGYKNRSEAIRDQIRDSLVQEEKELGWREMLGVVSIVYSHHSRELMSILADLQHQAYKRILSTMHIHLDQHNCLEVLVVRGKGQELRKIADRLIGTRGVKHGKLSLTTLGKRLL